MSSSDSIPVRRPAHAPAAHRAQRSGQVVVFTRYDRRLRHHLVNGYRTRAAIARGNRQADIAVGDDADHTSVGIDDGQHAAVFALYDARGLRQPRLRHAGDHWYAHDFCDFMTPSSA
jgi:hypothetical protein